MAFKIQREKKKLSSKSQFFLQQHSLYIKIYVLANVGNLGTIYKTQNNGPRNAESGPSQLPRHLTLSRHTFSCPGNGHGYNEIG